MPDEESNLRALVENVRALTDRTNRIELRQDHFEDEYRRSNKSLEDKVEVVGRELFANNSLVANMQRSISDIHLKADGTHEAVVAIRAGQEAARVFEERTRLSAKEMQEVEKRLEDRRRFWVNLLVAFLTALIVAILGAFLQVWFQIKIPH